MTDLHPIFDRLVSRAEKEARLQQRGAVIWLFGLSGSGKSTIATALERQLHEEGRLTKVLDGDNVRSGLNKNLGFSDEDRQENIRRVAEVAKLFAETGIITLVSVITPRRELRQIARGVIGPDLQLVYVRASYDTCAQRDPKGLYAKVAAGKVQQFTGKDSGFEEPDADGEVDLIIDTEAHDVAGSVVMLRDLMRSRTSG